MADETGSNERLIASALGDDLSFLLARANALSLAAGNAALSPHGLRVRSYSVLALAAADGARPTQRELAEFLRLDPSQVVALVDDLERTGLVARRPDQSDRRAKVVVVTDAGRDVFAAAQDAVRASEHAVHAFLDDSEHARLAELLRRVAFPVASDHVLSDDAHRSLGTAHPSRHR
ncbi:MarR family winged helix-turn-helix transcriptional regulator [Microbacterium aurantiacum]|uniref:MarR family winged helix-turn-helix transcriptional regulator n=1 Tax=Microbacterium aurantiacum TaxID=162393 RepID=UPI000C8071F6|nr:MarR family transcriptional regulator [Microbacterium aurantiacum]